LRWDGTPGVVGYRILRADLSTGAQPEVRDMTVVATLEESRCPEPLSVVSNMVWLPNDPPQSVVAVYRAEEYDLALSAGAQTATPIPGPYVLSGASLGGLNSLSDGTLVFVVSRTSAGAIPRLQIEGSARAWRDRTVTAGQRYQYRVQAVRRATLGPTGSIDIYSFASEVVEGAPFDPRPPVPPTAEAAWQTAQHAVRISWLAAGLPAGLDVAVQRMDLIQEHWTTVSGWMAAASGGVEDTSVASGHSYLYRLRARNKLGRTSQKESEIGPVDVP
jgi:hypothetical protein